MKISVLVPWHPADAQRVRVWEHLRAQWYGLLRYGVVDQIVEGRDRLVGQMRLDQQPPQRSLHQFSVSRALNDAARRATGDVFLLFGADHIPDKAVIEWAKEQLGSHGFPWTPLFRELAYASEDHTDALLIGPRSAAQSVLDNPLGSWMRHPSSCPGVLAVTRSAWETLGGMDEEFEGPGYEDNDLVARLTKLYPVHGRPSPYTLRELWHGTEHRVYGSHTRNSQLFHRKHGGQ